MAQILSSTFIHSLIHSFNKIKNLLHARNYARQWGFKLGMGICMNVGGLFLGRAYNLVRKRSIAMI